ncbi:MAG TPA: YetF domain-containing protein [Vicinamibacterales bacterium]|nr:YetF domain-containing protein [Vicinamibacterales bacterium]
MDTVLRTVVVYLFVLVVFRISGKRSLSQITTFDFILLLIIGEATQQALVGNDFSIINAFVVIGTLVTLECLFSRMECRWPLVGRVVGSLPVVVVEHGKLLKERAEQEGVTLSEILTAGRERHGLERLEQFKYAILERHGGISVVPIDDAR